MKDRDPESTYVFAGLLSRAGYPDAALPLLRKAVEGNYLAVPAMDDDPLLDSIRKTPEFAVIRAEAVRRQQEFMARTRPVAEAQRFALAFASESATNFFQEAGVIVSIPEGRA